MKILTPDEYCSLNDNEKLSYNYKESVFINVMRKGFMFVNVDGIVSYALPVTDNKVKSINIVDGNLSANTIDGSHNSDVWDIEDSRKYFQLVDDAKYCEVKDMNNKTINVGDTVVFIHSYSRTSNGLVKGVVGKIEKGTTMGSCRVYFTSIEECDDFTVKIFHPNCTLVPDIKYKLASSLLKI